MTDSVYVNLVIGIEELNAVGISVYPNPVNDVLFIKSDIGEIGKVSIYDVTGRIIYHELHQNLSASIDIKSFTPGFYILYIQDYQMKLTKQ